MALEFKKLTTSKDGLIYSLLNRSYEDLTRQIPELVNKWQEDWKQYDEEVYKFPETVGASGFITIYNEKVIGFGSYDARQKPELGIIGHNCILPEYRGQGFGKAQILKIVSIFRELGVKKVKVTTGEHPFFNSAQKMYSSCNFMETRRFHNKDMEFREIEYILEI